MIERLGIAYSDGTKKHCIYLMFFFHVSLNQW